MFVTVTVIVYTEALNVWSNLTLEHSLLTFEHSTPWAECAIPFNRWILSNKLLFNYCYRYRATFVIVIENVTVIENVKVIVSDEIRNSQF